MAVLLAGAPVEAAERFFEFEKADEGGVPPGWRSLLAGAGRVPEWKILLEDVPPTLRPLSDKAPVVTRRAVLAQVSRDPADERFPLLAFDGERYGDFTAAVRFKIVDGVAEQMAGMVFRLQDERNFYVVRASALGNNVRFYKFVDGQRSAPIGPEVPVARGEWHELEVACTANRIRVRFNGAEVLPELTDNSFSAGRVGFFTKSDTVAYFADLRMDYRPLQTLAETLLRATLEDQPRLLDLRIYGSTPERAAMHVMAAKDPAVVGEAAGEVEEKVFTEDRAYYSRSRSEAVVTAPIHDRNGEVLGVARFVLKPYAGQMESVTISRILPMVRSMEQAVGAARTLVE